MTDSPPQGGTETQAPPLLRAPGGVLWMLFSAPFLIAAGAFITVAMQPFVIVVSAEGEAVFMGWLGVVLLCLGVAFLIAGVALVGVRSLLQQQTQLLRSGTPARHPE